MNVRDVLSSRNELLNHPVEVEGLLAYRFLGTDGEDSEVWVADQTSNGTTKTGCILVLQDDSIGTPFTLALRARGYPRAGVRYGIPITYEDRRLRLSGTLRQTTLPGFDAGISDVQWLETTVADVDPVGRAVLRSTFKGASPNLDVGLPVSQLLDRRDRLVGNTLTVRGVLKASQAGRCILAPSEHHMSLHSQCLRLRSPAIHERVRYWSNAKLDECGDIVQCEAALTGRLELDPAGYGAMITDVTELIWRDGKELVRPIL